MTRAELEAAEHGSIVTITARLVRGMEATHSRASDYVTVMMGPEGAATTKVNVYADHITSVSPPPPRPIAKGDTVTVDYDGLHISPTRVYGEVMAIAPDGLSCAVQWPAISRGYWGDLTINTVAHLRHSRVSDRDANMPVADNGKHQ